MARRIIVAGAIAQHPLYGGGNSWAFLAYVLGFRRLGFDTYYVEHLDPQRTVAADRQAARYFREVMDRFGLSDRAALLEWQGTGYVGKSHAEVEQLAHETDLFVNISGRFRLQSILDAARRRLYLDIDPGYLQIWQAQYGVDMNLQGHDVHVTVGLNLGAADCPLPTCGIQWQTTLPPALLSEWSTTMPPGSAYTTVADWRGYSPVEWQGVWYGQKADEFARLIELPRRISVPLEICLNIHPDEPDRVRLEEHGWRLVSPLRFCATPDTYRDYIVGSRGEFTAVKHGYAAGRSGWFSDRSACYLAAGRPVIVQDTGIAPYVPTGNGLLTFGDLDSAAAALEQVERDYARHAAAATAFAHEYLDSDRVLTRLLQLAGL